MIKATKYKRLLIIMSALLLTTVITACSTADDAATSDGSADKSIDTESVEFNTETSDIFEEASQEDKYFYADSISYNALSRLRFDTDSFRLPYESFSQTLKNNANKEFYIRIDPQCIEYFGYKAYANYLRKEADVYTVSDYKRDMQWIIEKDKELFKSLGIDVQITWYCIEIKSNETNKLYAANDKFFDAFYLNNIIPTDVQTKFTASPSDDAVGAFGYIYTAYVKGEDIDALYTTLTEGYEKTREAFTQCVKNAFPEYSEEHTIDARDYHKPFYALYGMETSDRVYVNDEVSYVELESITLSTLANTIDSKWKEHIENGLRPPYSCGGELVHLTKDCTVEDIVLHGMFRAIND